MRIGSSLPARAGVGFKPVHFGEIPANSRAIGFFEVHAGNYMGAGGILHLRTCPLHSVDWACPQIARQSI